MAKTHHKRPPQGPQPVTIYPKLDMQEPPAPPAEPEPAAEAQEAPQAEAAPAAKPERRKRIPTGTILDTDRPFWEKIQQVPESEWGESGRYYIYLYRIEPYSNTKVDGQPGYLMKFFCPIDVSTIMERYGSGRYHMKFKMKKAGQGRSDTLVDDHTFEIYNPEYPPKLDVNMWKKDSRNDRWLALLPAEPKPEAQTSASDPIKMFEVFERMADRMESRYQREEPEAAPDPADQFNTVVTTAKDLLTMAMGGQQGKKSEGDEMMKFVLGRLAAAEDRAATLVDELIKLKTAPASGAAGTGATDPLDMFDKMLERVDKIKEKIAPDLQAPAEVRASRMNGWQEFGLEIAKGIFQSQAATFLAQGFLVWVSSKGAPQQPHPGMMPQGPGMPQQPTPQPAGPGLPAALPQAPISGGQHMKLSPQQLAALIGPQLISPLMLHLTDKEKDGYDLAQWVIDGRGRDAWDFLRAHGVDTIMESFRLSPYWQPQGNGQPGLSSMEPQLRELIEEFCADGPPPDEEPERDPATPDSGAEMPIDLT